MANITVHVCHMTVHVILGKFEKNPQKVQGENNKMNYSCYICDMLNSNGGQVVIHIESLILIATSQ